MKLISLVARRGPLAGGAPSTGARSSRDQFTGWTRRVVVPLLLALLLCAPSAALAQYFWDDIQPPLPPGSPTSEVPSSSPGPKHVFDQRVFFPATKVAPGRELFWTHAVIGPYWYQFLIKGYDDLVPGPNSSGPGEVSNGAHFVEFCGRLFFTADRILGGTLYPQVLHTLQPGGDVTAEYWPVELGGRIFSGVDELTLHGDELWFTARGLSPEHGTVSRYPWRIHSPIEGPDCLTERVDLVPPSPAQVPFVTELESGGSMALAVAWFGGAPVTNEMQIWSSRGTPLDSSVVVPSVRNPSQLTYEPALGFLYYTADGPDTHTYLARTDLSGAAAGNVPLFWADGGSFQPRNPT
ncbi:MAG: hypothetical protein MI919_40255, partial [Holophagales bacterium]|nr:hypothetical protein [Holophagales bacterium]